MGPVLVVCGSIAFVIAGWRSYALAREAIAPITRDGDPTRAAIESVQPLPQRPRVRLFARLAILAIGWFFVGLYGAYLVVYGQELTR